MPLRFDLLGHLKDVQIYSGSDYMVLDESHSTKPGDHQKHPRPLSQGHLAGVPGPDEDRHGARNLARWLHMPLQSEQAIARRLDAVEELAGKSLLHRSLAEEAQGQL